jgi:hypothetical protein
LDSIGIEVYNTTKKFVAKYNVSLTDIKTVFSRAFWCDMTLDQNSMKNMFITPKGNFVAKWDFLPVRVLGHDDEGFVH